MSSGGDAMKPHETHSHGEIELPAPTVWPVILAFGLTLLFAGLLTSAAVSVLGGVLTVAGCMGWFRQVLPEQQHEMVRAPHVPEAAPVVTGTPEVARIELDREVHRARIPIEIYPVAAGVKGGLAGSVAMAVLACLHGLISHDSIWFPINLLAAIVFQNSLALPESYINAFHPLLLLVASLLHVVTSILVGLLYGVMLPMFPRRPILLGGLIAPVMWSGLLYASLGIINPLLDARIEWGWFVASQIGFGLVAGLVVVRQQRVKTRQFLPLAVLAGIEAPGIMEEKDGRSEEK
jgi:hypothetical protein